MSDKPSARAVRRLVPDASIPADSLKLKNESSLVTSSFQPRSALKSHIGVIMSDAYSIIATEIRRLRYKAETGEGLNPLETRQLAMYVEQMARVAKEERAQEARHDPSSLTDEQLLEQAFQALKAFLPANTYHRILALLPKGSEEGDVE